MTVDFDPRTGKLVADEATLDVLLRHASGSPQNGTRTLAALRAAAAVEEDGRVHAALDVTLDAMRYPEAGVLSLSYAGKALHGWLSAKVAALLMPADGTGRRALLRLHPSLLPEALARAVDLSPRPRPVDPKPVDQLAGDGTVVRWWRLMVGWPGADGRPDGRMLEVVDTYGGLFTVEPGQIALPATPTGVWRLLVRLTARTCLDGLRPLPPDADIPADQG